MASSPRRSVNLDELRKVLRYEPSTGLFYWRVLVHPKCPPGSIAGSTNRDGYVFITYKSVKYGAHRLAYGFHYGFVPRGVDHRNCIRDNNWIDNLRPCDQSLNGGNQRLRPSNSSGIKGVSWCKNRHKWVAQISRSGKRYSLGRYNSPEEAKAAYAVGAKKFFGEYARLDNG